MRLSGASPFLRVAGYAHSRALLDGMHAWYHCGMASDFVASCLVDMHIDGMLEDTMENSLYRASNELRDWLNKQKVFPMDSRHQFRSFTCAKIGWKGNERFPELSVTYKCGFVRQCMLWLAWWFTTQPRKGWYQEVRALAAWSFAQYHMVLHEGRCVLSEDERARAHAHGQMFLDQYMVLHAVNIEQGRCLFKIRPKSHMCWHIIQMLLHSKYNPRYFENWLEEDMLGKLSKVFSKCHTSTRTTTGLRRHVRMLMAMWFEDKRRSSS